VTIARARGADGEIETDDSLMSNSEETQRKKSLTGQADALTKRARTLRGRARICNVLSLMKRKCQLKPQ
jgi:hypothetical protein